MSKIVKITPISNVIRLTLMTDIRCNYNCSYCPSFLHSNTANLKSFDELANYWTQIFQKTQHLNLPYKVVFSGGEVTTNKNFLPFLEWLDVNYKDHICERGLTTNGSASTKYYFKLINVLDWISFSSHSEFFDKERFVDTIIAVNLYSRELKKSIHVNIMDEPWAQETVKELKQVCQANFINHSVNPIYDSISI